MQFTPRHMKAQRHDGGVHACFEEQAMWVNGTIPQTNFSILSIIDPKGYPTMLLPLPFLFLPLNDSHLKSSLWRTI